MGPRERQTTWSARAALLRPSWWLALGLLLVNDHYLKGSGALSPLITGKLSNFAGLLMSPAVLAIIPGLVGGGGGRGFLGVHVGVGVVFVALKLSPGCAAAWCSLGGAIGLTWRVVSDPTDLVALPMLALSYWLFGPRLQRVDPIDGWRRLAIASGKVMGFVAIVATSRPPPLPPVLPPSSSSVYVPLGDGWQELDRHSGRALRRIGCEPVESAQAHDGVLYGLFSRRITACELSTGRLAWQRELGRADLVFVDSRRLVARTDSHVWVLDSRTGHTLWEREGPNAGAVALGERLLVHDPSGALEFLSLADGRHVGRNGTLAPGAIAHRGQLYGFQGKSVVVRDDAGALMRQAWPRLSAPTWAAREFPGDTLLASSQPDSALVALDVGNLRERWRVRGTELVAVTGSVLYTHDGMTCRDNRLAAREVTSGRALWSIDWCPWNDAIAADESLLLWTSSGARATEVAARDPVTGRPRWLTSLDD